MQHRRVIDIEINEAKKITQHFELVENVIATQLFFNSGFFQAAFNLRTPIFFPKQYKQLYYTL